MSIEKVVPLTSVEGHNYLIEFSRFSNDILPQDLELDIPLINVVIVFVDGQGVNNASTLFGMADVIKSFLDEHDVILYCFCDNAEILRGVKNQILSPQKFRSHLFCRMFDRKSNAGYVNKPITIPLPQDGEVFIHLFSRIENLDQVELVAANLEELNK